ncbi:MAG: TonB-dependent receptor [Opitutae bacterium]|nr:TonB-dependent receptor [Opitutae bacterium]
MRPLALLAPLALACGTALAQPAAPAEPPVKLADFVVTPSRYSVSREGDGSKATLTRADLESLPQVGEDLFRSIARLPGVAADDFTAKFWVRGAPQRQLLVRLDGADLLEPFHLKDVDGALSIVDLRAISQLDLMTGGFNADFGNRAAAVLTMDTLSPTAATPHYSAGLSVTSMRAGTAGTFAEGRGRWFASVRRGYPDLALKLEGRAEEIFPRYWDAYAKTEFDLSSAHTVSLHLLHSGDTLRIENPDGPDLHSSYDSDYAWARWRATWSERVSSETVLAQSWLAWRRDGAGIYLPRYRLELRDRRSLAATALRQDWNIADSGQLLVRAGWQLGRDRAEYSYHLYREDAVVVNGVVTAVPRTINLAPAPDNDAAGAFVATRYAVAPSVAVEPGLRFDRNSATGDRDWSPRLNAAWQLAPRTTLRAACGAYAQAQGAHELAVSFGDDKFHPSEKAEHRVIGLEQRLPGDVNFRVEAYERLTHDPRPQWFNRYDTYGIFPEAQTDRILLAPTRAHARGLELIARRRGHGALDWSASYALSRATQDVGGATLPAARDQRHAFYADATYRLGKFWSFGAAWQYHTGWPTTAVNYTIVPLASGSRTLVRSFGPTLAQRLPDYHRLDLRASRTIPLRRGVLTVFVDVFNAYDRANPIAYDYDPSIVSGAVRDGKKPRDMLPIVPTLGISWEG